VDVSRFESAIRQKLSDESDRGDDSKWDLRCKYLYLLGFHSIQHCGRSDFLESKPAWLTFEKCRTVTTIKRL
jgi:hypothetical protein